MSVCSSVVWLNVLPVLIYLFNNRDITTSNPHIGTLLAYMIYTTYLNSFQKKMHYFFDHNIDHVLVEIFIRYNIMKNLGRQSIRIHRLLFWKHLTIGWPCKNAFMEYISLNFLNKQYKTIFCWLVWILKVSRVVALSRNNGATSSGTRVCTEFSLTRCAFVT